MDVSGAGKTALMDVLTGTKLQDML